MMHDLKSPHEFTSSCAQCDNGVGPLVVAFAATTVVIGSGAAGGNEDEVAFGIDRNRRPGIPTTCVRRRGLRPRNRIPGPAQFAGASVERTHNATSGLNLPVVGNGGTYNHEISRDRRRGSHLIAARPLGLGSRVAIEVNLAPRAEISAWLS